MLFDINEFLEGIANVLDVIETDIFGVPTNHSKRIACFSNRLANQIDLSNEIKYDLAALSILHDNGASLKILHDNLLGDAKNKLNIIESRKEHCIIGEKNIKNFPFLTKPENVILYHHEKFDGSGFFSLKSNEIPIMSQLISFADILDLKFNLGKVHKNYDSRDEIILFIKENTGSLFSKELSEIGLIVIGNDKFWEDLSDDKIDDALREYIPSYKREMGYKEIGQISEIFSYIIDAKSKFTQSHSSGLSDLVETMADFYKIEGDEFWQLVIAANLHDLGKLGISNSILDKPGPLSNEEFEIIKSHPKTANDNLENIKGFENISRWAYNHHEKLNGSGYPRGINKSELDFNSRLLACLDIYQALGEERPYRLAMEHAEAMKEMNKMVEEGLIDDKITKDIGDVFYKK